MAQNINLKIINQEFQGSNNNDDDNYIIKSEGDLSIVDSLDIQRRHHQIGNIPEEEPRLSWGLTRDQIQYQLMVNIYQGQHWMQKTQRPEFIPHDDLSISENSEVFSNAGSDLTEETDHILAADPIFFFEDEWADAEHSDYEYIDDGDHSDYDSDVADFGEK